MSEINGFLKEEMPREKLISNGPETLTNVELLAIILRVGSKGKNVLELSREILVKFNMGVISRKTYKELLDFNGISKAKACQIVSIFELSRRLSAGQPDNRAQLNSSKDVYDFIKMKFSNLPNERVMIILVDSKNKVIKKDFIFEGSINFSIVEPRKIVKESLLYNASGFFLIHNHPSGDSNPSEEDIKITKRIKEISDKIGIRFLDHIIIGDSYFSLFDNELI